MNWKNLLANRLKEVRIIFDSSSSSTIPIQNFIKSNYKAIKMVNYEFPFLVRECENSESILVGRYNYGVEKKYNITNYNEAQIEEIFKQMIADSDKINNSI